MSDTAPIARLRSAEWAPAVLVVAVVGVWAVGIWHLTRGTWFFYDEWDFVLGRRAWTLDAFLQPHNGHLVLVPVVAYRLLLGLVGLHGYWAFRIYLIGLQAACGVLMFLWARRRVNAWLAAVLACWLVVTGRAWQDMVWPFQAAFFLSSGFALAALLALDDGGEVPWRGWLGAGLLLLSVASSALGLPMVAGVVVMLAVARQWRRLGPVAAALAVYLAWYLVQGESQTRTLEPRRVVPFGARVAANAAAGLTGLGTRGGAVVAALIGAATVAAILLHRPVSPPLAGIAAMAVLFWLLLGVSRYGLDQPDAARYIYPGALFLLLLLAEVARAFALHPVLAAGVAAVLLLAGIGPGISQLRAGAGGLREEGLYARAELGALEAVGRLAAPVYRPDTRRMPQVSAAPYLVAAAGGSAATPPPVWPTLPEPVREQIDRVLAEVAAPAIVASDATATAVNTCLTNGDAVLDTRSQDAVAVVRAGPAAEASVWLRRYADRAPEAPAARVPPNQSARLVLRRDGVPQPWLARVEGAEAGLCLVP